jgi:3-oxoacyl-[acyl-carrier protein] reductase
MKRTLVVTGASRGLGRHIAEAALTSGYNVIGLARNSPQGLPFELRICDVAEREKVDSAFADLRKESTLYALINAASIASMNLLLATPAATVRRIIDTNLIGTIHCSAVAGKILAKQKNGRIINFSTIAVPLGLKGETVYVASKAGVEGFTRSFAREMADFNVTVNAVAPGPIPTALTAGVPAENIKSVIDQQIIQKSGTPDDVWNIVSLLLEDRASMITGEVISVGGA